MILQFVVWASIQALYWQLQAWSWLWILCLPLSLSPAHTLTSFSLCLKNKTLKKKFSLPWGTWVAQSFGPLRLRSWSCRFISSSPALGLLLLACQRRSCFRSSLCPSPACALPQINILKTLKILSPPLPLCPPLLALSLSPKKKKKKTTEIQGIIRECHEQLFANKLDNIEEMDEFLETCNLLRINQEKIKKNINDPVMSKEIASAIKFFQQRKFRTWWLYWWILPNFKKLIPILL